MSTFWSRYPPNRSAVISDGSSSCTVTDAGICFTFGWNAATIMKTNIIDIGYQFATLSLSVYKLWEVASNDDPVFARIKEIKPQFLLTDKYSVLVDPGSKPVKNWHYQRAEGPAYFYATMEERLAKYEDTSEKWSCDVNIMFDGKQLHDYLISQPMVHVFVPIIGRATVDRFTAKYIFQ